MKHGDIVVIVPRQIESPFIAKIESSISGIDDQRVWAVVRPGNRHKEFWYEDCVNPIDSLTKLEKALYGV